MKFRPHYFSDLLHVLEDKKLAEIDFACVVNAVTAFCRGHEDADLDRVAAYLLDKAKRGSVKRSQRNIDLLRAESRLTLEHGSRAQAYLWIEDQDIQPDTIRKLCRASEGGTSLDLAAFVTAAKAGKPITKDMRQAAITELEKIRRVMLKTSSKGRDLREKLFGQKAKGKIGEIGESELDDEIFQDVCAEVARGVSKRQAIGTVATRHELKFETVKKLCARREQRQRRVDYELMNELMKNDPQIQLSPRQIAEALARRDIEGFGSIAQASVAVSKLTSGGMSLTRACETVGRRQRLPSHIVLAIFRALETAGS